MAQALEAYLAGELARLDGIGCATAGTPFQRAVWAALRKIQASRTLSYGALAARLGHPRAVRAGGLANGGSPNRDRRIMPPRHRR